MTFNSLQSWSSDNNDLAFDAFLKSCETLHNKNIKTNIPGIDHKSLESAFNAVCHAARERPASGFFEQYFDPYQLSVGWNQKGLLTGYYEPLLEASLVKHPNYPVVLYKNPNDLITVDLGQFHEELSERQLVGRLEGQKLIPYHSRKDIVSGALQSKNLELLWVKDPINAFFLQIQGSGRVKLSDGRLLRIGYAGKNGHPYTAIGRVLADQGEIKLEDVSLQTIRQWLVNNPDRMDEILNENASYVFFHILEEDGPIGSAGAVLTAEHSIAVDPKFIPLGMPVWISGKMPDPNDPTHNNLPFQKLLIAQDTGGAIKGELRGDIFWGFGAVAELLAGHMKHEGEFYLLLPKGVVFLE